FGMPVETMELCRLLTDCLKKNGPVEAERLSALTQEQSRAFLALAADQRISPLLWHRLKEKGVDGALRSEVAEQLRESFLRNTMRNLRLYGELHLLLSTLNAEGISLLLLKGIYLAEAVYGIAGLREMSDIDVLARPADLERIVEVLAGMGYAPLQPIHEGITDTARHHLPPMVKKGHASFEIHWDLTPPNERYRIDPGELWKRAVRVNIAAGCDGLALSPEDLLLHLCWHTSDHHRFAFGLRPSCDIAQIIARFGPELDWHAFTELAISCGSQRGVYLALELARELAGADVPAGTLDRLRPADMSETIMGAVRAQTFTIKSFANSIPESFADFLEHRRFRDKIRIFGERVFLPKAMIAAQYSVPMDSVRIYGCYGRRVVDLLRRHGPTLKKCRQDSDQFTPLVERTNLIADWLDDEVKQRR
ncbi:MAG TPA: nucleotidyltransferase family protein, partial [Geobacteraceae bacterium]